MKYTVVSSAEYTYPDIWEYATASDKIDVFSARDFYATFQILLADRTDARVTVEVEGLPAGCQAQLFTLTPVRVEKNYGISPENYAPHYPERVAPYWMYDCLRPFDGTLELSDGVGGVYVSLPITREVEAGDYHGSVTVDGETIPMHLKVYPVTVPTDSLKMIVGYSEPTCAKYHGVEPLSDAYFRLEEQYLAMMRRMRQNMMYTGGIVSKQVGENKWEFDFSRFVAQVKRYEAAGMRYFNAPAIGRRKSWEESTIMLCGVGLPAMSYEGFCYLTQYLPALRQVLRENGWIDCFVMGIADEPNDKNATEFRALCGLVRKLLPEIKLIDAIDYGDFYGALDIWVPRNEKYDRKTEQIEMLRADGSELWYYVCCGPRTYGYINRFMDYPLLSTRYLHWANYKYNMKGFLHWAVNVYQPGQDPFTVNCPEHHNADRVCFLPPGDTHVIYPGKNAPWMSIRLEAERESAEEYELLCALAEHDRVRADAICERVFHSFCDVEYDVDVFIENKRALLEALSNT